MSTPPQRPQDRGRVLRLPGPFGLGDARLAKLPELTAAAVPAAEMANIQHTLIRTLRGRDSVALITHGKGHVRELARAP
eukprot:7462354-Pyramimonas_sp.AAC.1